MPGDCDALTADRDSLKRIGRKVRRRLDGNTAIRRIAVDGAELWAMPRFFDAIECGRLMAMIDTVARPSTAYEVAYAAGHRTSYSGDLNPYDALVDRLQKRIDGLLGIDSSQGERLCSAPLANAAARDPSNLRKSHPATSATRSMVSEPGRSTSTTRWMIPAAAPGTRAASVATTGCSTPSVGMTTLIIR